MPTLIDGDGGPARGRERGRRARERVSRLAAAVQEDRRTFSAAITVADELVARGAGEIFRNRRQVGHQGLCARKSRTPCLNTGSPTARIWSRPGMSRFFAPGISAASSGPDPAMSSFVPVATSTGTRIACGGFARDRAAPISRAGCKAFRSLFVCSANRRKPSGSGSCDGSRARLPRVPSRFSRCFLPRSSAECRCRR